MCTTTTHVWPRHFGNLDLWQESTEDTDVESLRLSCHSPLYLSLLPHQSFFQSQELCKLGFLDAGTLKKEAPEGRQNIEGKKKEGRKRKGEKKRGKKEKGRGKEERVAITYYSSISIVNSKSSGSFSK
jgi:hypothetical protein